MQDQNLRGKSWPVQYLIDSSMRWIPSQEWPGKHSWPPFPDNTLPTEWDFLPFVVLPDGVHAVAEEYVQFHLPPTQIYTTTTFGISCYRQIPTDQVENKSSDMTRSSIQKSIVVLASKPILSSIKNKLGIITESFFNQKDFNSVDILASFYESLLASLSSVLEESHMLSSDVVTIGVNVRPLIQTFKTSVLKLMKAVLIGKKASSNHVMNNGKVMFYGHDVEKITGFQYALISLVPEALLNLHSCASTTQETDYPLFGLSVWLPYIPLQQIEVLFESTSYLAGTSNALFLQHKRCTPDVVANVQYQLCMHDWEIETGVIDIVSGCNAILALSAMDRKWMQEIVDCAHDHFIGSDEDVRNRFIRYIHGIQDGSEFNQSWVNAYKLRWDIQGIGHPCTTGSSIFDAFKLGDWGKRSKSTSVASDTSPTAKSETLTKMEEIQDDEDDRLESEYEMCPSTP